LSAAGCLGAVVVDRVNVIHSGAMPIQNCTGAVVLGAVDYRPTIGGARGSIEVTHCPQVACVDCRLPHVEITASSVCLAACSIRPEGPLGAGLHVVSGSAVISGGVVAGSLMSSFPSR
jgi:hypothetical protein